MIPAALVLLALLDGALLGYRSGAGRMGLVHKRPHVQRAVLLGLCWSGLIALGGVSLAFALTALRGPELWPVLERAGASAVQVFGGFAALISWALVVWFVPLTDLRTFVTVSILGPGTLVRPFLIVAGMTLGFVRNPRWEVALLGVYGAVLMLALEPWLTRRYFPIDQRLFDNSPSESPHDHQ